MMGWSRTGSPSASARHVRVLWRGQAQNRENNPMQSRTAHEKGPGAATRPLTPLWVYVPCEPMTEQHRADVAITAPKRRRGIGARRQSPSYLSGLGSHGLQTRLSAA